MNRICKVLPCLASISHANMLAMAIVTNSSIFSRSDGSEWKSHTICVQIFLTIPSLHENRNELCHNENCCRKNKEERDKISWCYTYEWVNMLLWDMVQIPLCTALPWQRAMWTQPLSLGSFVICDVTCQAGKLQIMCRHLHRMAGLTVWRSTNYSLTLRNGQMTVSVTTLYVPCLKQAKGRRNSSIWLSWINSRTHRDFLCVREMRKYTNNVHYYYNYRNN